MGNFEHGFGELGVNFCDFYCFNILCVPKQCLC